ncbi:hypothetical protein [Sphingobium xenophagum]|uniref:hypothetical protein n=1 Tax=Sphingobium xenophagum TaxID=121428 RepID=UPI001C0CA2AF|nr:hypothetical protein [Sphingobium xenophagum]QWT15333.1 hypothetical protein GTV57_06220 [Sphingobium xenophagum]
MTAYRLTIDIDTAQFQGAFAARSGDEAEALKQLFTTRILTATRKASRDKLHEVRTGNETPDTKARLMGDELKTVMLTVMAEANLAVEALPADFKVKTELPFEMGYSDPLDA